MFDKVLIANRGEIAVRVARACRELGVRTVAVYSTADRDSAVVRLADESVCIGPPPSKDSYLNAAAVVEAALQTGADAVHPGYGFLSEDPDFAQICADNELTFIGPPPEVLAQLGDKATARALMQRAGLPLLPGSVEVISDTTDAVATADQIGFPVIVKAAAGGGGRGMTVVSDPAGMVEAYRETRRVALSVFGDDRVYVERYLERARHVEVQFLCDAHGRGIHLGTRDCSVQRRRQKLVEEAPAPALSEATAQAMCHTVAQTAVGLGFTGAGTAEFLVDEDERYHFMEINSRIQVEHPVSEMVTGVDLVQEQLRIAAGMPLRWRQADIELRGVSMECRVNAEDPRRQFVPTPAAVSRFVPPGGPFTRVDTHGFPGCWVGPDYDSLLAKVVVWGHDREEALQRMDRALGEFDVDGPGLATTIPFLRQVLAEPEFRKASHCTDLVDRLAADPVTGSGTPAAQAVPSEEKPSRTAAEGEEGQHERQYVR
jgi:acetyl-CoA carboxylase biotin carboxylase subunit